MSFLRAVTVVLAFAAASSAQDAASPAARLNVVLVLADDLGVGELGCYGQRKIKTPHLDALAAQGMRFTNAYAGSCVCAPSRCTILTGRDTGRCAIRDNKELGGFTRDAREGQEPLPKDTPTLARFLQQAGYTTAAIGKWGLGGPGSEGVPAQQGFDHFFGYLCQRVAHNHYPEHLWRNADKVLLPGNVYGNQTGQHYAPDLMRDEALGWLRKNHRQPFFLYYATTVPHAALQVPADSLAEYAGAWDDPAYDGKQGYLPHAEPRAAYAAMVTRMDRDVGRLLALLDELELADDTLVIFTSDNGPTFNGGTDSQFFDSASGRRGRKCSLYEGGIRTPLLVRWPGRIAAGSTSDHVCSHWDLWSTIADAVGEPLTQTHDGVSFLPTLLGQPEQKAHDSLYWEYHASGGIQAARIGNWKAVRRNAKKAGAPIELYDLAEDPNETKDVAGTHPEVIAKVTAIFAGRTPSPIKEWNF